MTPGGRRAAPGRIGRGTINDAPRAVVEAALAAFDARRPGLPVLDLLDDSRLAADDAHLGNGLVAGPAPEDRYVLRFGDGRTSVVLTVEGQGEQLVLSVEVPGRTGVVVLLEQLAPGLRVGRSAAAPATFAEQPPGFVSITGLRRGRPQWCTAWVRLAVPVPAATLR